MLLAFASSGTTCGRRVDLPLELSRRDLFIQCGDPAQLATDEPFGFGLICGANGLRRYGLRNGLQEFCIAKLALGARYDPYAQTCTILVPLTAHHRDGVFCQTKAPTLSNVKVRIRDVTRPSGDGTSVEVADSVYMYTWNIDGADQCKLHPQGHDLDGGLGRVLETGGARATRAKEWLRALHDETWDYIAGINGVPSSPACVGHPDDE